MRTEIARMREILRKALPERAFLRRDRGDALFITNAPAFDPVIQTIPGFILIPAGKLLRILPDSSWITAVEQREAPGQFAASLARFRGLEPDADALRLFAQGLKLIDMGASTPAGEAEAFDRSLRQRAALALRGATPGGGLYAAAILNHDIKSIKEK